MMQRIFLIVITCLMTLGCSTWEKLTRKEVVVVEPTKTVKVEAKQESSEHTEHDGALKDERDLKVAKLWARVDELEEEVYRQKERIVILERGMTLGLVPEELKYPERSKSAKSVSGVSATSLPQPKVNVEEQAIPKMPAVILEVKKSEESDKKSTPNQSNDREEYELAVAAAHDSFRSGRYGRAIVEYSAIGKKFGDQIDGAMHLYWIAKSWANLKEFNTSKQQLEDFIKKHGDSPWTPRAKLDLGRVEWQLGLRESALATFKSVIQKYPLADAAEMARMELENLSKKL